MPKDNSDDSWDQVDYRPSPDSPGKGAGNNGAPSRPGTDIREIPGILFGARSSTVDMASYEYSISDLKPGSSQIVAAIRTLVRAAQAFSNQTVPG